MGSKKQLRTLGLCALLFLGGCAKERPVRPIISNNFRIPKSVFAGAFYYLKTLAEVRSPGKKYASVPPGIYADANEIVNFVIKESSIDVVRVDKPGRKATKFKEGTETEANPVLASFPVRHVDVLLKLNDDNQKTHIEEETETRRVWQERDYVVIDVAGDTVTPFVADTKVASPPEGLDIDQTSGAINFTVTRHLKDGTFLKEHYSFLKRGASTYQAKPYPRELQTQFGYFKTTINYRDEYGRLTYDSREEYINRWDTSRRAVYYLSKDFPVHLKPVAFRVFDNWNKAFREAVGHDVLELRDNSGQELGDLRYSFITYENSEHSSHHIVGYGPSFADPWTGQVIKGDVMLYGGVLRRSVFQQRIWEELLKVVKEPAIPAPRPIPLSPVPPVVGPNFSVLASELTIDQQRELGSFVRSADLKAISNDLLSLRSSAAVDRGMIDLAMRELTPAVALKELREESQKSEQWRMTKVDENFLGVIQSTKYSQPGGISDTDLEVKVFTPLLTHELGHTLGLRHNFLASADRKHFGTNSQTSSIMDYGYLASHEGMDISPYDRAAIVVQYSSDASAIQSAKDDNFYYCTDHQVMDSRNALCNQNDAGTTLSEVVTSQAARYQAGYFLSNLRLNQVAFSTSTREYYGMVLNRLLPLRQVFDNATAIQRIGWRKGEKNPVTLQKLWYVLGQRIEADKASKAEDVVPIEVEIGIALLGIPEKSLPERIVGQTMQRKIDLSRIEATVKDAETAQLEAFFTLAEIIVPKLRQKLIEPQTLGLHMPFVNVEDERNLFNIYDGIFGELLAFGVIYDKIAATLLVGVKTEDPAGGGNAISMFSSMKSRFASDFFQHLISSTLPVKEAASGKEVYRPITLDNNVREVALALLISELAVVGSGAEARELLSVEQVNIDREMLLRKLELSPVLDVAAVLAPVIQDELKKTPPPANPGGTSGAVAANPNGLRGVVGALASGFGFDTPSKSGLKKSDLIRLVKTKVVNAEDGLAAIPGFLLFPEELGSDHLSLMLSSFESAKNEYLALEKQSSKELKEAEAIEQHRARMRHYYRLLYSLTIPKEQQPMVQQLVLKEELERNRLNSAFIWLVGDQYFKSRIQMPGYRFHSAVGHLLRDNANQVEDRSQAMDSVIALFTVLKALQLQKPEAEQDKALIAMLTEVLDAYGEVAKSLRQYVANERLFAKRLYRYYIDPNQ